MTLSGNGGDERWPERLLMLVSLLMLLVWASDLVAASPTAPDQRSPKSKPGKKLEQGKKREREGTQLTNLRGIFKETGDRFTFYPTKEGKPDGRFYQTLENLALERIQRIYSEGGQGRFWSVSGRLTEFRGNNFLMITKATLLRKRRIDRSPVTGR